ncbi:hypothetical protein Tco_1311498 [Tanacetum coccineum]
MPPKRNDMSVDAIEQLITQHVADALLTYEANQNTRNENGNGNGNDNGNGSHDLGCGSGRPLHTTRGCTYNEFLNCQPLNFKGTEGASGLAHWFEKMEYVFHISNCVVECQVKYATCTLLDGALKWWNSHFKTVGHDAAYEMSWKDLMKMITEAYCPRNEIQKLETELWNLTMKGTDVVGYTQCFQKLALLYPRMVLEEEDKVERFIWGLTDSIQGNGRPCPTTTLQEAERSRAYTTGPGEKKEYAGTLPLCNKCRYHHTGPCTAKCENCKRIGHQTKDCRSLTAATNHRAPVANQRTLICFECGKQGHYCSECPKLKNRNRKNQAGSSEARRRVYALGGGETNQDPSNIVDDIDD